MRTFLKFSACFLALLSTQTQAVVRDAWHDDPDDTAILHREITTLRSEVAELKAQLNEFGSGMKLNLQDQFEKFSASENNISPRFLARTQTKGFLDPTLSPWNALGEYLEQSRKSLNAEIHEANRRLRILEENQTTHSSDLSQANERLRALENSTSTIQKDVTSLREKMSYMANVVGDNHRAPHKGGRAR